MSTQCARTSSVVVFLAVGSLGDVRPLACVARELVTTAPVDTNSSNCAYHDNRRETCPSPCSVVFATHQRYHDTLRSDVFSTLPSPPSSSPPSSSSSSPTDRIYLYSIETDPLPLVSSDVGVPSRLLQQSKEWDACLDACTSFLSHLSSTKGCAFRLGGIVCNLFSLVGWHIAQHLQVDCFVLTPCLVPKTCPDSFAQSYARARCQQYQDLTTESTRVKLEGGRGSGALFLIDERETSTTKTTAGNESSAVGPAATTAGTTTATATAAAAATLRAQSMVSWCDVRHWMWRLLLDDYDEWIDSHCLGTEHPPSFWCDTGDSDADGPRQVKADGSSPTLPPRTTFIYGIDPLLIPRLLCRSWPSGIEVSGSWRLEGTDPAPNCPRQASPDDLECGEPGGGDLRCCVTHEVREFVCGARQDGRMVLLVTLGSMEEYVASAPGLLSMEEFLSVLVSACQPCTGGGGKGYRIILMSSGPLASALLSLQRGAPTSTHSLVLCCGHHVPFEHLLPLCDVVLHHGGAGTTHACLAAACVQLVCPILYDQSYWAKQVERLRVGVTVDVSLSSSSAREGDHHSFAQQHHPSTSSSSSSLGHVLSDMERITQWRLTARLLARQVTKRGARVTAERIARQLAATSGRG